VSSNNAVQFAAPIQKCAGDSVNVEAPVELVFSAENFRFACRILVSDWKYVVVMEEAFKGVCWNGRQPGLKTRGRVNRKIRSSTLPWCTHRGCETIWTKRLLIKVLLRKR